MREVPLYFPCPVQSPVARGTLSPSSASFGLADYAQVDAMRVWYRSVNLTAQVRPGSPNRRDEIM